MQALDDDIYFVVVEETLSDSEEPVRYGLILDALKISKEIVHPLNDKGFMLFPSTGNFWTKKYIAK